MKPVRRVEPSPKSRVKQRSQNVRAKKQPGNFPVIGIGASAGGLEAFGNLLRDMPPDTGMAFILIQHIQPDYVGNLVNILQKYTTMPVIEAKGNVLVEPNHLYFIPQNREISIQQGVLGIGEKTDGQPMHSIDLFFKSLANDLGDKAICIILSGTGTDGTLGARAITAGNGLVVVQDPEDATYDGMPLSAIDAGLADLVLPVSEMAGKLIEYQKGAYGHPDERQFKTQALPPEAPAKIFALIKQQTDSDFSGYKPSTITRRIERRMNIHMMRNLDDYVRLLETNPGEIDELRRDFMISVTSFFRDREAFVNLKKQLKTLIREKDPGEEVRIWSAGCSTGEEAYSLAIIVDECLTELKRPLHYLIFATDLDTRGIETARNGVYPESIGDDITKRRLDKYFITSDSRYKIKPDMRKKVIFAVHNVLQDPPFSRLDVLSIRNVMIYLDTATQRKLLPMMQHALRPGGLLFLGSAETIGTSEADSFTTVDRRWRIYRAIKSDSDSTLIQTRNRYTAPYAGLGRSNPIPKGEKTQTTSGFLETLVQVLPPAVILDGQQNIVFIHGETRKFLHLNRGRPSSNILDLVQDSLRPSLSTAIHQALSEKRAVIREIPMHTGEVTAKVTLTVTPVQAGDASLAVVFEESPVVKTIGKKRVPGASTDEQVAVLEQEIQITRDNLKITLEELETATEELRSSLEEYQSTNEELHSTNEELETSREELQSMNEELTTLNQAYQRKIEELTVASDDLGNLLNSTNIAAVFLNEDLTIKGFTPASSRVLSLRERDIGRPITEITSKVDATDIAARTQTVLDSLVPVDAEVVSVEEEWYSMRIFAYRSSAKAIEGAVITFTDITAQKQLQDEYKSAMEYANSVLDTIHEPLVVLGPDMKILTANKRFLNMFKVNNEQTLGRLIYEVGNGQWNVPELRKLLENILPENKEMDGFRVDHDFPGIGLRSIILNARQLESDAGGAQKILLAMEDITDSTRGAAA